MLKIILEYLKDIINIVYALILIKNELKKSHKNKNDKQKKKASTPRKGKKLS